MAQACSLRRDEARARLAKLGMSQSSLADQLGLPLRTVQRWFAGGRTSLEKAEAVAMALGLGTAELFDGVPSGGRSPFIFLRGLAAFLGRRDSPLVHAAATIVRSFEILDMHVTFAAHPLRGYVRRIAFEPDAPPGFARFGISPLQATRIAFGAQVTRSLGYEFGVVAREGDELILIEHFHTRSMRARAEPRGCFEVEIWVPHEMRELILVADADLDARLLSTRRHDIFDLADPRNAHALCFRPAPTHLRQVALPTFDDRLRGHREGRVDYLRASS